MFYFSSYLPPSTVKETRRNASSRLSLSSIPLHILPSNLTTKTMDCVSFCFSAFICFAIWERVNTWWKNISAFFVFFAGVDKLGWILGYHGQHTQDTTPLSDWNPKPGAAWNGTTKTKTAGDLHSQHNFFEVLPPFPTASSSHSTIFGCSTHSLIPPSHLSNAFFDRSG